jgi:3,4-dihydroxy 2-butanone 4-phosphate synthase/GTP cyclohydrolase II
MDISTIEEVIEDLKQGKMIILVDDEDRENEGDLTMVAEKITPEAINFMSRHARGLICLALDPAIVEKLDLKQMVRDNRSPLQDGLYGLHCRCPGDAFRDGCCRPRAHHSDRCF